MVTPLSHELCMKSQCAVMKIVSRRPSLTPGLLFFQPGLLIIDHEELERYVSGFPISEGDQCWAYLYKCQSSAVLPSFSELDQVAAGASG